MRLRVLAALTLTALAGIMTIGPTDANAAVCARGVARAGCVGPHGAAVVGAGGAAVVRPGGAAVVRPVAAACRWVVVNGVRVRRCV
jgi:hypothetical protein